MDSGSREVLKSADWQGSICKSKYDGIDFSVTPGMISAAKRGLELRKKHKRGGTAVGATRAGQIVNRKKLSPDTWKRVFSYFSRHEVDKQGKGWGKDSAGYIAWLLWGGDAGFSRSRKITKQMKARDEKKSLPHHETLWNSVFKAKSAGFDLEWPPEAARGVKTEQPSNDTPKIIERPRASGELLDG